MGRVLRRRRWPAGRAACIPGRVPVGLGHELRRHEERRRLPAHLRERILTEKDAERLERRLETAILAASVAEVIHETSSQP